jgi:hypothetical protein
MYLAGVKVGSDPGETVVITRTSYYGIGQSTYKGLTKRSTSLMPVVHDPCIVPETSSPLP